MAIEQDVLEFVIVPPYARRAEIFASKERIEAYLGNRFPGYSFKVARLGPVSDDDDFCVIPIMNFLGDDGQSYMCNEPKSWFIGDIAASCRSFAASSAQRYHS